MFSPRAMRMIGPLITLNIVDRVTELTLSEFTRIERILFFEGSWNGETNVDELAGILIISLDRYSSHCTEKLFFGSGLYAYIKSLLFRYCADMFLISFSNLSAFSSEISLPNFSISLKVQLIEPKIRTLCPELSDVQFCTTSVMLLVLSG